MSGFAGLVPILAMATFLIFLVYLVIMKKKTEEIQDEHDTTALAKSTTPSERNPAKRVQKGDILDDRKTLDYEVDHADHGPHGDNRATAG